MDTLKFLARRLAIVIPQLLGITLVSFLLVRMLPGNPAIAIAGSLANDKTVAAIEARMGLDKPLLTQFWIYLTNILKGDFGNSWYTSNPVLKDIVARFPATLELISISMMFAIILGVLGGLISTTKQNGIIDRISKAFSLVAGALPEFWLGLVLIYFLYFKLNIVAPPLGRLDIGLMAPKQVTGMILIDSLLAGNLIAFRSALSHMFLPVLTLTTVLLGPILKMTRASMLEAFNSEYIHYARMCGIKEKVVSSYALRSALAPIVTIIAVYYGFMLGGAVLVETVFTWGGIGQYAVQSVVNKDFNAIQGFLIASAIFSLVIYLLVDIIYMKIDPRIKA